MQSKLNNLAERSSTAGLTINVNRTESLDVNTNNPSNLTVAGQAVEKIENFKYLGSQLASDGGTKIDIEDGLLLRSEMANHNGNKPICSRDLSNIRVNRIYIDASYGCAGCDRPDSADNIVQCDKCSGWWHFSCASVNASIADRSIWICEKCLTPPQPPRSVSNLTTSSNRRAVLAINLQRLAEEQELRKKELEITMEKEFVKAKYDLLEQCALDEENDARSVRSRIQEIEARDRDKDVNVWVGQVAASLPENKSLTDPKTPSFPVSVNRRVNTADRFSEKGEKGACMVKTNTEAGQSMSTPISLDRNDDVIDCKASRMKDGDVNKNLSKRVAVVKRDLKRSEEKHDEVNEDFALLRSELQKCQESTKIDRQTMQELRDQLKRCQLQLQQRNAEPLAPNGQSLWPLRDVSKGAVPKSKLPTTAAPLFPPSVNLAREPDTDCILDRRGFNLLSSQGPHEQMRNNFARLNEIGPSNNQQTIRDAGRNQEVDILFQEVRRPSPEQLAARQVMPRDLPDFHGDPEEWPLFISSLRNTTSACGYSRVENLARLQRSLKGNALKSVRYNLLDPDSVPEVIRTLQTLYGRPEVIISRLIKTVREAPAPKSERLETLIDFGMAVRNLVSHLIAADQRSHLANPVLLQELVEKLPANVKMQWAQHLVEFPDMTLQTFSSFMSSVVESVSKVVLYSSSQGSRMDKMKPRDKGYVHSHVETVDTLPQNKHKTEAFKSCIVCGKGSHRVKDCFTFKNGNADSRWKTVTALNLCRCCLGQHGRRSCRSSMRCEIDGCQLRHHPLLHSATKSATNRIEGHNYHHCGQSVLFRILPVTISGPSKSIDTFAFLDEGSSATLVEQSLADQLNLHGPMVPLCLKWTADMYRSEENSQMVSVQISALGNRKKYCLKNARTVERLNLPSQTLCFEELQEKYQHLSGLPIRSYQKAVPRLLIGLRNLSLAVPQRIKEGKQGPIAVKTRVGWCVYGSMSEDPEINHFNYHICECDNGEKLDSMIREYFNAEEAGLQKMQTLETDDVRRARCILEKTTRREGNHFATGLLWKHNEIDLPNSFPMALQRLKCLERRMSRDPVLKENLHRQLQEYQNKHYAHPATEAELNEADPRRIWYLPLGAVVNPKKPKKVRLIWDAAAKVNGVSLNTFLLPGPDLLVSLPSVLFRFRQYPVATCGDIKEMFHQIKVTTADRHSQRFLWRATEEEPPRIFLMDVLTFGSTSSPSSAQFVKNKNAKEHEIQFPRAAEGIMKSTYVDDYLDSFENVEEAKLVADQVRRVYANGGFEIRNWSSNEVKVLEYLGECPKVSTKDLMATGDEESERVLGMLWLTETDMLSFSTMFRTDIEELIRSKTRPTKRQLLKTVMSLFDPLGLLASFLVHGKIIMQQVWRAGTKWDEYVDDRIEQQWQKWIALFNRISEIQIPRCYFQAASNEQYGTLQTHLFVDASEAAYSAVVYFRIIDMEGNPRCSLVTAKTKVAPLKYVSIPRLELMAAVLGARLLLFVEENHTIPIKQRFCWSDSNTVLAWLRSEHRRYKQFVACRVGEVLELTKENEWRWVPSKLNVADEATKWGKGPCFDVGSRWVQGPEFLSKPQELWPRTITPTISTEEELRPCHLFHDVITPLFDFERFSNWSRLLRTVAFVFHPFTVYKANKASYKVGKEPTHEDLRAAEIQIWKTVQWTAYSDEISILTENKHRSEIQRSALDKSSPIYKLTPMLDDVGVLRIDSRTGAARVDAFDLKYPVILPRKHHVTYLIVDYYHRKYLHGNAETIVNELRQKYYIPRIRVTVRTVTRLCQWCKVYKSQPAVPRMAPLPEARLSPGVRPFSYIGIDYFGPTLVKVGRSNAKRWICLITCLTVRAVHVEVAYDLSTQSCIACIRRFICRRGAPLEIYSDNGRNFVGANGILQEQMQRINKEAAATFTNTETKWFFIPPSAPHMGGSWERLVRSVKTALMSIPQDRKFDDEALLTHLVEAESIVNSRPLTYLPLDSPEQEALTPNHFILGSSSGVKQPPVDLGCPSRELRNTWVLVQENLNYFWKRWIREYLPTLTRRTKWFGEVKPINSGDLVVIIEDNKRNGWTRGRIVDVMKGKDGRVRQAVVQTTRGLFKRPVSRLAVLDVAGTCKAQHSTNPYGEGNVGDAAHSATLPTTANC
ncbi:uncharacterized protein LOC134209558 [Armigeres subalbatus]|uniref:uncharacterized protein LOC134209558 n=1 Tax=Armigeres subalbatus TaxID=124917 RepID=UPI002ED40A0D